MQTVSPLRMLVCGWTVLVTAGIWMFTSYQFTPGRMSLPDPERIGTSRLRAETDQDLLVLFAHPHCPCLRTTLSELERILAVAVPPGKVKLQVLFVRPAGTPDRWELTELWRWAAQLPGATVVSDFAGKEASCWGVQTSGTLLLLDADQKVLFRGGITLARDHAGDNRGARDLLARLNHEVREPVFAPAYGCPLQDEQCSRKDNVCQQP